MTTRGVLMSILALAGLSAPAHATITYCNSGCTTFNNNSGMTYAAFDTVAASFGNIMSSPITFVGGLDVNGAYNDATLTTFTGYNNNVLNSLQIIGTNLAQTVNGTNTGINITLPVNTYAFAMFISTVSGFGSPMVEIGDLILNNANYSIVVPADGTPQFFGIVSSTPITSMFLGNLSNFDGKVEIKSFEVGGPASSETPEVSTFLLIGTGLVLMRFLRRRQQRRRQTTRLDLVFS